MPQLIFTKDFMWGNVDITSERALGLVQFSVASKNLRDFAFSFLATFYFYSTTCKKMAAVQPVKANILIII